MAITYHAGRRIQGTQADFDGTPAVSGGWKELARTTLGSNGDSIDVSSLADKRYLMFLLDSRSNGTAISTTWKANGSTGNEYSFRRNHDGTEGDATTQPSAATSWTSIVTNAFGVGYAANKSGKEKLFLEHEVYQNTAGAGTAPTRTENAFKWTGTDVIDQLTMHNSDSGDIVSGSELVVLGYDPDDTHTDNFWEELASVDSTGDQTAVFSSAKKYIWIQVYVEGTSGLNFRMGNTTIDTGSNYSYRNSSNGGADGTSTNQTGLWTSFTFDALPKFYNFFMINNASNEKLIFGHAGTQSTAGAGNAPNRLEIVGKWTNTSNQADRFQVLAANGTIGTNIIKVWGSN